MSNLVIPLQVPRGTKDILPDEINAWQEIERKAKHIFSLYNYCEIRTPIFENIAIFKRSLGETSEIVGKQMFIIKQGEDELVLRPEATASIARAYIENNLSFGVKLRKLFYIGPMFRAERPQKGRLRQFHHIGVEAIGSTSPYLDIEIIELCNHFLSELGISNYKFLINSLGCPDDKQKFSLMLKDSLLEHKENLCKDCQDRFSRNIFRILDCKNEQCRQIVSSLKFNHSYLCSECKSHFDIVLEGISGFNINYQISEQLVRGLDYYSGVVFEITHPDLGAQDALGAGGRYDYLFKELADKEIGAVGFAFGQERLLLVIPKNNPKEQLKVYIITLGEEAAKKGLKFLRNIRVCGISCDFDYSDSSLKSKLKEADRLSARFVIIIGEDEIKKEKVVIRCMKDSDQQEVDFSNIVDFLKQAIAEKGL